MAGASRRVAIATRAAQKAAPTSTMVIQQVGVDVPTAPPPSPSDRDGRTVELLRHHLAPSSDERLPSRVGLQDVEIGIEEEPAVPVRALVPGLLQELERLVRLTERRRQHSEVIRRHESFPRLPAQAVEDLLRLGAVPPPEM